MTLLLLACAPPLRGARFEAMSTTVEVVVEGDADAAARIVEAVFADVETHANEWSSDADIGRLNREGRVQPDEGTYALLQRAVEVAEATDGAFDPTWAALWDLWRFPDGQSPDPEAARSRVLRVGWRGLSLEGGTAELRPGAVVGLGGIAKGWALDRSAEALVAAGYDTFSLSAGGQVLAHGRPGGRPWRVGIRDPRGGPEDWFALVEVEDASVSTSGDYERFFFDGGVRQHHILDPRTGFPARGLRSATVIAKDGTTADALSTALMVMGAEGLARVEALGAAGVVVTHEGAVEASPTLTLHTRHAPIQAD